MEARFHSTDHMGLEPKDVEFGVQGIRRRCKSSSSESYNRCEVPAVSHARGQRTPGKQALDVQKMTSFILGKNWYILVGKLSILVGQKGRNQPLRHL